MSEREYRLFELKLGPETILTNEFDFGCACIVQDYLLANEDNTEETRPGEFAVKLVDAVLYRMLEGKILDFALVKTIPPSTKYMFYLKFRQWYTEDLQYLNTIISSVKLAGVNIESESSGDDKVTFLDLWYMFFKHHSYEPESILKWKFQTVANILYLAEKEKTNEYIKKNPLFQ